MSEVVLLGLAAYRLWRLAAVDTIFDKPRDWLLVRTPEYVETLLLCPYCSGSWIAFGLTWATDAIVGIRLPILVALSAAVLVPLIHSWLESEDG